MSRVIFMIGLVVAAATAVAAEQDYQIKFHRAAKVGDTFSYASSVAMRQKTTATLNGQERKPSERILLFELEARCKVMKVEEHGNVLQASYAIERFVKTGPDQDVDVLPKGTRVIAEADLKQTRFSLPEGKLTQDQQDALDAVIQLDPEDHLDDVIYGTAERKKVGDSWPLNVREYVRALKQRDTTCREEDVKATIKLEGVEELDGVRYLKLLMEMNVGDYKPSAERSRLPAGLSYKSASIETKRTLMLPVDPDVVAYRTTSASMLQQAVESADGTYSVKAKSERATDTTILPIAQ